VPRYKMLVFTSAVTGREGEFNEWYQSRHLPDVTAVPGFRAAQRFKLAKILSKGADAKPYLSIYEIETDDLDATIAEMRGRARTDIMPISDAMATGTFGVVYEEAGDIVSSIAFNFSDDAGAQK
jgi:hypothetical protein